MYTPSQPVLLTSICPHRSMAEDCFYLLPSNGVYVRHVDGSMIGKISHKERGLFYKSWSGDDVFAGLITDEILIERITTYIFDLLGQRFTNCSAMAHFLTTGNFIECEPKHNLVVLEQNMHSYTPDTKVGVGDMICIVYARERIWRSRHNILRGEFLKQRKQRHRVYGINARLSKPGRVFSAEEVKEECRDNETIVDYSFMVCVAMHDGEPVWISQEGHCRPGEKRMAVSLTKG